LAERLSSWSWALPFLDEPPPTFADDSGGATVFAWPGSFSAKSGGKVLLRDNLAGSPHLIDVVGALRGVSPPSEKQALYPGGLAVSFSSFYTKDMGHDQLFKDFLRTFLREFP